jgi:hypothetical protein
MTEPDLLTSSREDEMWSALSTRDGRTTIGPVIDRHHNWGRRAVPALLVSGLAELPTAVVLVLDDLTPPG